MIYSNHEIAALERRNEYNKVARKYPCKIVPNLIACYVCKNGKCEHKNEINGLLQFIEYIG